MQGYSPNAVADLYESNHSFYHEAHEGIEEKTSW
jgi:hypothetical protein